MSDPKMQNYMQQLLDELGWNKGTRIPLANPENKVLESLLISRQEEIQRLKETLILQNQKQNDLNKYKEHVQTEFQENTKLLFAHKQQLEKEVKLKHASCNEADSLTRDINACSKQSAEINCRIDKLQNNIARFLKKADNLKSEVCGERGALQEWRTALERSADDISAIEKFTKQDLSKAKALETKRQKLKADHDRTEERLNQLVSNLNAEERACDRISVQVMESMEQRKQMMGMWAGAVENLRQRDTDIRHTREDYAVLENEVNRVAEQCREQQAFCDQQRGNNAEAERHNFAHAQRLSNARKEHAQLIELNVALDSEMQGMQRELHNLRAVLERLHAEKRRILDEQRRRDTMLMTLHAKIADLKEKCKESMDKTKSSEKRAKELETMLNDEERYATQLTVNQQRAMHCSFREQQKLLAIKNEEKLFHMHLKASKAAMSKLDNKQQGLEKSLLAQKEALYAVTYQVETIGARVSYMEGAQAERLFSAEKLEREKRLEGVRARHAARVALLERHTARLHDDMRRLAAHVEALTAEQDKMQGRLRTSVLNVEGGDKELRAARDEWRRARVEQALLRLRVAHAERAVAGLGDAAYTIDTQRLQLDAAMNERLVEIAARRDMFSVQKRALLDECGKLRAEIAERLNRIEQLKKRYEIFIASLGKDESGRQLSVTFFKIKFAAERAELREHGAALDADIGRTEREVAALEATLRVMHAAHSHFMHNITPLNSDTPEMEELFSIQARYYEQRDELRQLRAELAELELTVNDRAARVASLADKRDQFVQRESECENELESARERVSKQEIRLENAREVVRNYERRTRRIFGDSGDTSDLRIFRTHLRCGDYAEAAYNALRQLAELCKEAADAHGFLAMQVSVSDLQRYLTGPHRHLHSYVQRILSDTSLHLSEHGQEESRSSSSGSSRRAHSNRSGFTRRLASFKTTLADKLHEKSLAEDTPPSLRATSNLNVVTLGVEVFLPGQGQQTAKAYRW